MNLVKPYQAMKEIWRVSHDPARWSTLGGSPLLGWWWGLWLTGGLLGQIVFRLSMRAENLEDLNVVTNLSIVAGFVGIAVDLIAIRLVKTIAVRQEQLVQK